MNPQEYVQTRCQRCGAAAWGHLTQTVPCSACGQPIAPMSSSPWNPASPYGAAQPPGAQAWQQPGAPAAGTPPPGAQAWQQPGAAPPGAQAFQTPAAAPPAASGAKVNVNIGGFKVPIPIGGGASKAKVGVAVVGVAVAGIAVAVVKGKVKGGSHNSDYISLSSLGLDEKKCDADKMIVALAPTATKWKKDAASWPINLQAVHADGTVDVSDGGAQVEYISPAGVNAKTKTGREDSIKKFSFGPSGVDWKDIWNADNAWDVEQTPPLPHCGIKNVVKQIKGLSGDKTVRVTFDPQFADSLSWHVLGEDPKIDAYYSMEDCSPVQK